MVYFGLELEFCDGVMLELKVLKEKEGGYGG